MTVSTTTARDEYDGNGATVAFPVTFEFNTASELKVYQAGTLKTLTTHYTVSGGSGTGGTVTFVTAPADGELVAIHDEPAVTQATDYVANDTFPSESHEAALDKLTRLERRTRDLVGRSLTLADGDSDADMTLPVLATRASKTFYWDSLGRPSVADVSAVSVTFSPDVQTFSGDGSDTTFTLAEPPGSAAALVVAISGVVQIPGTDYTVSGTTLTFTSAPPSGTDNVMVQNFGIARLVNTNDADAVTYTPGGSGAVNTDVQTKLRERVSVKDFGAALDGTTDDSTDIQAALNSGVKVVDGLGTNAKVLTALTVPAGVEFVNFVLTAGTAGMNVVLVNTGCKVQGKITGTGTLSTVERAIYPAATGVTDVDLDVEVTNITFGVQASPAGGATAAKRWKGKVYAHDIVGTAGDSEGYGVLLETAEDCDLVVHAKTIKRHALYLSAGAKRNKVALHVDGCGNYAAQLYSTSAQTETADNDITIFAQNLTTDVAGQSGPVAIVQKANRNTVRVFAAGNATTVHAAKVEGASGGPYPTGNKIIGGSVTGQFTGDYVVEMTNADSTIVTGNTIHAYAVAGVIGMRRSGTNGTTHGGYVEGNYIDAQAQAITGIYNECNAQPSYIGPNDIRNNGAALRVNDQTGGLRQGYSRRVTFSGTTASINATVSGDTAVTLSDSIQTTGRNATVTITGGSVQLTDKPFWTGVISAASETALGFRVYNGHSAAQTFDYAGWVEGD